MFDNHLNCPMHIIDQVMHGATKASKSRAAVMSHDLRTSRKAALFSFRLPLAVSSTKGFAKVHDTFLQLHCVCIRAEVAFFWLGGGGTT